ncbi:hypothetical protein BRADI_3g33606v3 [Brachypodium distachyon]|uniref:Uncharacterized protein n=1 Tax=Brachypodium distachyon TaxID=15368 RepID=A0A2K2D0U9_BRADI|nr:hypothetical protein BRADI_3g33606v3 [Brachypodium distachyon]
MGRFSPLSCRKPSYCPALLRAVRLKPMVLIDPNGCGGSLKKKKKKRERRRRRGRRCTPLAAMATRRPCSGAASPDGNGGVRGGRVVRGGHVSDAAVLVARRASARARLQRAVALRREFEKGCAMLTVRLRQVVETRCTPTSRPMTAESSRHSPTCMSNN